MEPAVDENLAQTLFERGAEKCKTHQERLAFCESYLKKHQQTPHTGLIAASIHKEVTEVELLMVSKTIAEDYMARSADGHHRYQERFEKEIKVDLARDLVRRLLDEEYIVFETVTMPFGHSLKAQAAIKAAKWKRNV